MKETIKYQGRKLLWRASTKFVDAETGEELSRTEVQNNYIKIKTTKRVQINEIKTKAVVEYTTICQKDLKLFENGATTKTRQTPRKETNG